MITGKLISRWLIQTTYAGFLSCWSMTLFLKTMEMFLVYFLRIMEDKNTCRERCFQCSEMTIDMCTVKFFASVKIQ